MRIKLKLILVFLALIIIPIIILNMVSSNIINEKCMRVYLDSIERSVKNQADDINFVCENIVAAAKKITIDPNVRSYTAGASSADFEVLSADEDYETVMRELERLKELDGAVIKAMLIDGSGIVIGSTESDEIGRRLSDYKDMFESALANNGFSTISMSSENNMASPVFTVSKSVYSEQNERIGILYIVYDTSNIQNLINSMKLDKYTSAAVMDNGGNILEYPYKNVRMYNGNTGFSGFSEELKQIIVSGGTTAGKLNTMIDKGSGAVRKIYYATAIQNSGWYLISYTDRLGLTNTVKQYSSSLELISFFICIVCAILVIVFTTFFARPVMEIIRVFTEKQKGNVSARFNVHSHDEFQEIGMAFNSMFDNIFESEQRYRTIVEMTNNIIFEINYKKGTVFTSKNFNKKFSFRPKDDTLQESFIYKLRIHKDDKDRYMADWDKILGNANFIQGEYRVKSIYGDFIWIMIKATKFFDRDEVPTKVVGVIVDIDREKKSEIHLLQRASYDNLTQLYNRETFLKSLNAEFEVSAVKKTLDAVMFIDLDDFKFFNDQFGHACGDEVLKFVADTIKEISFERGFAGRFGGDEFVVCFTNLTLYGDSGKIAQEIIDVLGKGFISESTGEKLSIKCSIGIAFLRESGKTTDEIVAAADEAMYNIKKHGKSAYAYAKSVSKPDGTPVVHAPTTTSAIDSDTTPQVIEQQDIETHNLFDPLS